MTNENTSTMQMLKLPRGSVEQLPGNDNVSMITLPVLITEALCRATQVADGLGFYDSQINKPAYVKMIVPTESLYQKSNLPIDPETEGLMFFSESKTADIHNCMVSPVSYGIMADAYNAGYQAEKARRGKIVMVENPSPEPKEENVLAVQSLAFVKTKSGSSIMPSSEVPDGKDIQVGYNIYTRQRDGEVYLYGFSVQNPDLAKEAAKRTGTEVSSNYGRVWVPAKYAKRVNGGVELHVPKDAQFRVSFYTTSNESISITTSSDHALSMIKSDLDWRVSRMQKQKEDAAHNGYVQQKSSDEFQTLSTRPLQKSALPQEKVQSSVSEPISASVRPQKKAQPSEQKAESTNAFDSASVRPQKKQTAAKVDAAVRTAQMIPPVYADTGKTCHYLILRKQSVYTVSADPTILRVPVGLNNSPDNKYGCHAGSLGLVTVPADAVVPMSEIPEGYLTEEMNRTVEKWKSSSKLRSKMDDTCLIRLEDERKYPVKIDAKHSYTGTAQRIDITGFDLNNYNVASTRTYENRQVPVSSQVTEKMESGMEGIEDPSFGS